MHMLQSWLPHPESLQGKNKMIREGVAPDPSLYNVARHVHLRNIVLYFTGCTV